MFLQRDHFSHHKHIDLSKNKNHKKDLSHKFHKLELLYIPQNNTESSASWNNYQYYLLDQHYFQQDILQCVHTNHNQEFEYNQHMLKYVDMFVQKLWR